MKLTLEMALDNDAFQYEDGLDTFATGEAVRNACVAIEQGRTSGSIIDLNGNKVGSWSIR